MSASARKILIFGTTGQVGTELRLSDWGGPVELVLIDRRQADLAVSWQASDAITAAEPDLVINASAYTAVDLAESEAETAYAINAVAPGEMASACAVLQIPLLHISTDFVFDGTKSGPYKEDDPVRPLGEYGRSKEAGEQAVRKALDQHIIVRTAWVFSAHGQNFVKTMLRLAGERDELGVVDDQLGCPTPAADIARAIVKITGRVFDDDNTPWGTYHFCGSEAVTWCGFARETFRQTAPFMPKIPTVNSIGTADYPTPAQRPANSVLDCRKLNRAFGVSQPSWQSGLADVIARLMQNSATENKG